MSEYRVVDEQSASRFALYLGADLVSVLDYRDDGAAVWLNRAFTIPTFRGRGTAGVLVAGAVDALEERGDREVVPMCWYVAKWFEEHPERRGILRESPPA